jgi:hypothetical protein
LSADLTAIGDDIEAKPGEHSPRRLGSEPASWDARHHLKSVLDRVERRPDLDTVLMKRRRPDVAQVPPDILCRQVKLLAVNCELRATSFVSHGRRS